MVIERIYNVPLRKGFRNTERYRKTKKAVSTLKEFLKQHLKSDKIMIGKNLNMALWKDGIKNPPHHIKVVAIKEDDGTVKAELFGHKYTHTKKQPKEEPKGKIEEKLEELKSSKKEKPSKTSKKEDNSKVVTDAEFTESDDSKDTNTESKPKKKVAKKTVKKE